MHSGPQQALAQLQAEGCAEASMKWITNHYGAIVWKLAGLLQAGPSFQNLFTWETVINQLKYR